MKIFHIKAADATLESENRFADLVEALAGLGISQHVLMSADERLEALFKDLGVPYRIQKFSGLFDLRTQQAAQQITESFGPHIIQTHSLDSVILAAKIQFHALRIGFASSDEAQHKKTMAASDMVLALSYPQQGAPFDYDILLVPPLVQDLSPADTGKRHAPEEHKPLIGAVIDLTPAYQIEPLFQAIRGISDLQFHLWGDGPAKKTLQEKARRLAVHDRVTFPDGRPDRAEFLGNLDICVVPFRSSGIDRLTLEAWSCGTCVLSGMPQERSPIMPEQDGWLVEGNDVLAWREQLTALLKAPERRAGLGKAGREKYEEAHKATRAISSYLQAYETALRVKV